MIRVLVKKILSLLNLKISKIKILFSQIFPSMNINIIIYLNYKIIKALKIRNLPYTKITVII